MIELHLLRHARASDPHGWDGPDATRPLTDEGRRQAAALAKLLESAGFECDLIVSSPRVRALQTAEVLASTLEMTTRPDERLAGGLDLAAAAAILADTGDPQAPVLVGHDPDLSTLLSVLVGADIPLRMGAMAKVELDELRPNGGTLRWLVAPEILPG